MLKRILFLLNNYGTLYKIEVNNGKIIWNKSIFKNRKITNFSITEIWSDLLKQKYLNGFESKLKFYHATNLDIFKKLQDL